MERKKSTKCTINNLPDVILIKIFELLSAPERVRVERVCSKWKSLSLRAWTKYRCIDDNFYLYEKRIKNTLDKKFKILPKLNEESTTDILKKLLSRCGKYVKSLDMKSVKLSPNTLFRVAPLCPNLEEVYFSEVLLPKSLATYCNKLQVLEFDNCFPYHGNGDLELSTIFRHSIHLTSLALSEAKLTGRCFSDLPTELKSFSLDSCRKLENGAFRVNL